VTGAGQAEKFSAFLSRKEEGGLEYGDDVLKRLRRIEGQVRGVLRMMDEGKNCKDVVMQMTAIRSAIDRAIAVIVCNIWNAVSGRNWRRANRETRKKWSSKPSS